VSVWRNTLVMYNVAQLLKAPVGTCQRVELDPADRLDLADDEVRLAGDVTGTMRLHRTNQGVLADGTVTAPVELQCDRCLESYTEVVTFPLQEQYYPTIDVSTGEPLPVADDELVFPIDQNHLLDLREAIRQNLLLALPMRTICREDCVGLCHQCGHNLNAGPCDCEPEIVVSRFETLRALLEE
jgi:uncharacterized protein